MDPARIFQLITNSTLLATRLLTGGAGGGPLAFSQARYCVVVAEDTPPASSLASVKAVHRQGDEVRYILPEDNTERLFSINPSTGVISLAAPLDYETQDKHEFVVRGEGGGSTAHALVRVLVADVNDNPPVFVRPRPHVTVIEEDDRDLPLPLAKVEARDVDVVDAGHLLYTLSGDGVDGFPLDEAYFGIDPRSGTVLQRRALDRDPPKGRGIWRLKVTVTDGQMSSPSTWEETDDKRDEPAVSRRVKRVTDAGHERVGNLGKRKPNVDMRGSGEEEGDSYKIGDSDDGSGKSNRGWDGSESGSGLLESDIKKDGLSPAPLNERYTNSTTASTATTTTTTVALEELKSIIGDKKEKPPAIISLNQEEQKPRDLHGPRSMVQWVLRSHSPHNAAREL